MDAKELLRAGKLTDAIQSLTGELRDKPTDAKARTFLFELLCFGGEYDRAETHLEVLSDAGQPEAMGALVYRGVLHAERTRQQLFRTSEYPKPAGASPVPPALGTLNGRRFRSVVDADPRIGANLEVFVGDTYLWIPFSLLASVEAAPPRRLRDLLWIPATVRPARAYEGKELGEVLLPALGPFSGQHPDEAVRLGRVTTWEEDESGQEIPIGQKLLLVDGEEFPILELRNLEFASASD